MFFRPAYPDILPNIYSILRFQSIFKCCILSERYHQAQKISPFGEIGSPDSRTNQYLRLAQRQEGALRPVLIACMISRHSPKRW